MLALRFHSPGDVRLEDIPEPVCGADEVKIRVRNCSTCGTDVKIRANGHVNITRTTTMGHEVAGEVVEVGAAAVGGFRPGDRVQVIAAVPCGDCHECRRGWMAVCQNQTSVGYQYDGGFAEYMIVPPQVLRVDGLNRIPDGVGFPEASAAEPLAWPRLTASTFAASSRGVTSTSCTMPSHRPSPLKLHGWRSTNWKRTPASAWSRFQARSGNQASAPASTASHMRQSRSACRPSRRASSATKPTAITATKR